MAYDQELASAERQITALTAERDRLAEEAASVCADAEVAGYYGDRADSAGVCFREAYAAAIAQRDQLRAAVEAVEWGSDGDGLCPSCASHRSEGHAPDCIVGLALERKA